MTTIEKRKRQEKHLKERMSLLEHDVLGNGAVGLREQIRNIEADVKDTRRILFIVIALMLLIIGDRIYDLAKTVYPHLR